jgi:hypothetical protein
MSEAFDPRAPSRCAAPRHFEGIVVASIVSTISEKVLSGEQKYLLRKRHPDPK